MARIRKAIIAALGAFVSGMITALINGDKPATHEGWVGLVGGCLGLALAAGIATYKIPNAGTVNGSDPVPGSRLI
jgi:hypothetical protein